MFLNSNFFNFTPHNDCISSPRGHFGCDDITSNLSDYSSWAQIVQRSVRLNDNVAFSPTMPGSWTNLSTVNFMRLARFMDQIRTQCSSTTPTTFTVVVFGSSMTAGRGVDGFIHAWPNLLQHDLNRIFSSTCSSSNSTFKVANRAVGGSTSLWALSRVDALLGDVGPHSHVDLVIVDYDITDCAEMSDSAADRSHIMATTELLVRRILQHQKQPAILFTNVAVTHSGSQLEPQCKIYNTCYSMGEIRQPILRAYNVPIVSQKYAIWENFTCPIVGHWTCGSFCSHPRNNAHHLMARLVSSFVLSHFSNATAALESGQLARTDDVDWDAPFMWEESRALDRQLCRHPALGIDGQVPVRTGDHARYTLGLSDDSTSSVVSYTNRVLGINRTVGQYTVTSPELGLNFTYVSCWRHDEDVKGKPGLVAEECWNVSKPLECNPLSDSLVFPVTYGPSPRLILTYLSTYTSNVGCIRVFYVRITNNTVVQDALGSAKSIAADDHSQQDALAHLPWEQINWIDPKRATDSEFERLSLTWVHSFIPEPEHYTKRDFQFGELADPSALSPHTSYLIKITQIDANDDSIRNVNEKQGRGGYRSPPPQKVKLFSALAC